MGSQLRQNADVWDEFTPNHFAFAPFTLMGGLPEALFVDVLLRALFAVQPSFRGSPAFKARWTRFVPASVERSTYVLASSAARSASSAGSSAAAKDGALRSPIIVSPRSRSRNSLR